MFQTELQKAQKELIGTQKMPQGADNFIFFRNFWLFELFFNFRVQLELKLILKKLKFELFPRNKRTSHLLYIPLGKIAVN